MGPRARKADITVGAILSAGMSGIRTYLQPASLVEYPTPQGIIRRGEAGCFLFAPDCATLAQLAFHVAAMTVAMQVDVRTCALCSRSFLPKHGAQKYCEPRHENIAKQRRFRSRRLREQAA
jgi:hypothetical protein